MSDFIKSINDIANSIFQWVLAFLPDSPFRNFKFPPEMAEFLGILNYYVPFNTFLVIGTAWIGCIAIYDAYQLILRKINGIR